jgi:hypothetical protein
MKKILLVLTLMAGCTSATVKPVTPPDAGPTVLEQCSEFRNSVCSLMGKCEMMEYDECTSAIDATCEEVAKVSDPKRLVEQCLPDLAKATCADPTLPKSCYEIFEKLK